MYMPKNPRHTSKFHCRRQFGTKNRSFNIYHEEKKRITAALLALGLSAVTICSQLPVFAAEETAQATDTATQPQTADPSVVTTNGIDGWPQASDISSPLLLL